VLDSYSRQADIILERHEDEIPFGLTKEIMMRKTVDSSAKLTGQNLWETIWESMNNYVVNKMLVIWMEIQPPVNSSIPSKQVPLPRTLRTPRILSSKGIPSMLAKLFGLSSKPNC